MSTKEQDSTLSEAEDDDLANEDNHIILELPPPPDGGYGWVIMIASFCCQLYVHGISFTFGAFLQDLVTHFDEPKSKVVWAGSLLTGGCFLIGPIAGALTNHYGCRPTIIVGAILSAALMGLSVLSPNAETLIVMYGLTGLTTGFIFIPGNVAVSFYFDRKRSLTTCIAACGSSIGSIFAGSIGYFLQTNYGWKGANVVFAFLYLSAIFIGISMRPLRAVPVSKQKMRQSMKRFGQTKASFTSDGARALDEGNSQLNKSTEREDVKEYGAKFLRKNTAEEMKQHSDDKNAQLGDATKERGHSSSGGNVKLSNISEEEDDGENLEMKITKKTSEQHKVICKTTQESTDTRSKNTEENTKAVIDSNGRSKETTKNHKFRAIVQKMRGTNTFSDVAVMAMANSNITVYTNPYMKSAFNLHSNETPLFVQLPDNEKVRRTLKRGGSVVSPLSRSDVFFEGTISKLKDATDEEQNIPFRERALVFNPLADVDASRDTASEQPAKSSCPCYFHESFANVLNEMIGVSLLKNLNFVLFLLSQTITAIAYFVPFFFITAAAVEKGVDAGRATFLISAIGIGNVFGRALPGILASFIDAFLLHNIGMFMCGVSVFCIGFMSESVGFACCAAVFGFSSGIIAALATIVIVSILSLDKLTSAFGLLCLFRGAGSYVGSPLIGAVYDATGNFEIPFIFSGVLMLLGSVFGFISMILSKREKRRNVSGNA